MKIKNKKKPKVNNTNKYTKACYKSDYYYLKIWKLEKRTHLCNVFFIVLDLRLTKDWLSVIDSLFLCPPPSLLLNIFSTFATSKREPIIQNEYVLCIFK